MRRFSLNSTVMCYCRAFLTISIIVNFIVFVIFSYSSNKAFDKEHAGHGHVLKLFWKPKHAGYVEHVVSNVAEWIMCVSFVCFSLTFIRELSFIRITSDFAEPHSVEDFIPASSSIQTEDELEPR